MSEPGDQRGTLKHIVGRVARTGEPLHIGTGWVYGATLFVTCAHVVEGLRLTADQQCCVHFSELEAPISARLIASDKELDVAVLHGDFSHIDDKVLLEDEIPPDGMDLCGFGYPLLGQVLNELNGVVQDQRVARHDRRKSPAYTAHFRKLDQMTDPGGWSGSPVLNAAFSCVILLGKGSVRRPSWRARQSMRS